MLVLSFLQSPLRVISRSYGRGLGIVASRGLHFPIAPSAQIPKSLSFRRPFSHLQHPLHSRQPSIFAHIRHDAKKVARASPLSFMRQFSHFEPPQLPRDPRKVVYIRYDPSEVAKAKPLIHPETLYEIARSPKTKWLLVFAFGSGVVFYVSHIEEVPVSGRKRFNCYSEAAVEEGGVRAYQMIMNENRDAILPAGDRRSKMVQRVMKKLIPASGLEHVDWEVHVINSPERNAFVIPGGKVFVYTGILDIARNDDGLAAILGHEIAHNLAHHAAEQMSGMVLLEPIRWTLIFLDSLGFTYGLGRIIGSIFMDFGIMRPASRKQESEADYIGLMMMAKACYDPRAAVGVWERMEKAMRQEEVPEWLSTHPSNTNRIGTMQQWLPKAEEARNESECSVTLGYAQEFQDAIKDPWVIFR